MEVFYLMDVEIFNIHISIYSQLLCYDDTPTGWAVHGKYLIGSLGNVGRHLFVDPQPTQYHEHTVSVYIHCEITGFLRN